MVWWGDLELHWISTLKKYVVSGGGVGHWISLVVYISCSMFALRNPLLQSQSRPYVADTAR